MYWRFALLLVTNSTFSGESMATIVAALLFARPDDRVVDRVPLADRFTARAGRRALGASAR